MAVTKYELEILRIINESHDHPTVDEVYERLKEKYPGVVKATCYNNLNKLSEEGLVRRVVTEKGGDRFDRTLRHDHLRWSKCGKISDVFLSDISSSIEKELGQHIESYDLKINWICPECREKGIVSP